MEPKLEAALESIMQIADDALARKYKKQPTEESASGEYELSADDMAQLESSLGE